MRLDLADDPAVIGIAAITRLDEDAVVGRLHRLWSWANRHLENGHASVTLEWCNRFVRCESFAQAMEEYGWLKSDEKGFVTFTKFDRWNSKGAKNRLRNAIRQARKRHADVTKPSRQKRDKSVTREEKSREEKSKGENPPNPPDADAVVAKRKEPVGPHADAVRAFVSRWEAKYGTKYPFAPKDGVAIAAMLKRCGEDVAKFTAAVVRYLAETDQFYHGHGASLMNTKLERWIVATKPRSGNASDNYANLLVEVANMPPPPEEYR